MMHKIIAAILLISLFCGCSKNVKITKNYSNFAVFDAVEKGDGELLMNVIKSGANVNENKDGESPLFRAIWNGNVNFVKVLVDNGADVNRGNHINITPLHFVARVSPKRVSFDDGLEMTKILIKNGADVNKPDVSNCGPVFEAVSSKNLAIAKLLIENGAVIDARSNKAKNTPLNSAVTDKDNNEMVKFLLDAGAKVDYPGYKNETAIFYAIRWKNFVAIKLLVEKGADLNWSNSDNLTPLDLIKSFNDKKYPQEIVKFLIKKGARYSKK